MSDAPPLLQLLGVAKTFPGVRALAGVDLELRAGEVLALVGANGAGKSTLVNTLAGVHAPDEGELRIDGAPVRLATPAAARAAGVGVIHQELQLVPALSVRENIHLGRARTRRGLIDRRAEREAAARALARLGVSIDPEAPVARLSVAEQQAVEIAKALSQDVRALVMDEPTAALTPPEVARLLDIVRELRAQGIGVVYISHRLEEVFDVADRVVVLRDGRQVACRAAADLDRRELIELMAGRALAREFPPRDGRPGPVRLAVAGLRGGGRVHGVSFVARAGEVLGVTGVAGAGRTELARLLFGADRADGGEVLLDGEVLAPTCPRDAIAAGVGLLTEDRKQQGLVLAHPVRENFGLPNLREFTRRGVVDRAAERGAFAGHVDRMAIRLADFEQPAATLSGGNQQKVVFAKWLQRDCKVLLIDEPTRGVDVAARYELYVQIRALAAAGKAVVMISSELSEVLGVSDRVVVLRHGRVAAEFDDVEATTRQQLLEAAAS